MQTFTVEDSAGKGGAISSHGYHNNCMFFSVWLPISLLQDESVCNVIWQKPFAQVGGFFKAMWLSKIIDALIQNITVINEMQPPIGYHFHIFEAKADKRLTNRSHM